MIRGYAADTKRQLQVLQNETDETLQQMQQETDQQLGRAGHAGRNGSCAIMGVNLRIVHRDTKLGDLYTDFVAVDFPEDYVQKLANAPQVETIVHLIATLQEKIKWNGRTVLLVGMLPVLTASQKNAEQQHMAQPVEPGTVVVGYELAAGLLGEESGRSRTPTGTAQLDVGEQLDVLGTIVHRGRGASRSGQPGGCSTDLESPRCPAVGRTSRAAFIRSWHSTANVMAIAFRSSAENSKACFPTRR